MSKLMLLAASLAMLVIAAVPAIAQVTQDIEQEIEETGDVDQSFTVTGGGDNSNQCANVQGVANTGNVQSTDAFLQYASEIEEFESEDDETSIDVSPTSTVSCDQEINQAAAASGDDDKHKKDEKGHKAGKKYDGYRDHDDGDATAIAGGAFATSDDDEAIAVAGGARAIAGDRDDWGHYYGARYADETAARAVAGGEDEGRASAGSDDLFGLAVGRDEFDFEDFDFDGFDDRDEFGDFVDEFCDDFDGDGLCEEFFEELCEDFDGDFFCDGDENNFGDNGFDFGGGISQNFDQEIEETGDVDQSFVVTGGGDNSNQSVNVQGVANTGNVQDASGFVQVNSEIDDLEFGGSGSSIEVSPTLVSDSDQQINQAAAAGGDRR